MREVATMGNLFDLVRDSATAELLQECVVSALKRGVVVTPCYAPTGEWTLAAIGGRELDSNRLGQLVAALGNPLAAVELLSAACREAGMGRHGQNRALALDAIALREMRKAIEEAYYDADTPVSVPSLFDGLPEGWDAEES